MSYYGNVEIHETHKMKREEEEEMEIYANADPSNSSDVWTEMDNSVTRHKKLQHTGSYSVRMKNSRAAPVCLVSLCFLLLTVVMVLSVLIYTNNTNHTEEKHQLITNIINITEDRDALVNKIINLTEDRDKLLTNITNLNEDQNQLQAKNIRLTQEKDELSSNKQDLIKQRDHLNQEKNELLKMDEWIYYRSNVYYFFKLKKSWTESRRDCRNYGADLVIIDNREEQDFVDKITAGEKVWIGLSDSDVEDSWKWVDDSKPTSWFWHHGEPSSGGGQVEEDCVLTVTSAWADYPCNAEFQWICEKRVFK